MTIATRYHDISCGHRVVGQGGKCEHLHGHNYRIHFTCTTKRLDRVGRVIDFSAIKARLCQWLEENWDHRFLVWEQDPLANALMAIDPEVTMVPFNPTAENMAEHLVNKVGPEQLQGVDVTLLACRVDETRKCSASYHLED